MSRFHGNYLASQGSIEKTPTEQTGIKLELDPDRLKI